MDLYEEDIPNLLASTKMYISIKMKLFDLLFKYHKRLNRFHYELSQLLDPGMK